MDRLAIQTANECLYCGSHVTPGFARQFGDRHGRVHRCFECDTNPRVRQGSAAGLGVDEFDPQHHPNRNHGLQNPVGDA